MSLKIIHDLSLLTVQELEQYKRDVSVFIGLDPNLNGLDTIWMENEHGPGKSLVLYARRGTAEILREVHKIEVSSLIYAEVRGSIVFTATGKNKEGRQEIATGSKSLLNVNGKALDNAIKSASTQALRRLTMQFTKLGILDESEIEAVQGSLANPAAGATLVGSPMVLPPQPIVPANNAPGRDVTPGALPTKTFATHQQEMIAEAMSQHAPAKADIKADILPLEKPVTPVVAPVTLAPEVDNKAVMEPVKPKRARKAPKTVSLDGPEPEVVSTPLPVPATATVAQATAVTPVIDVVPAQVNSVVPIQANPAVPISGTDVPKEGTEFPGKPTLEQMGDYRKRVGVYTAELPSSENMGSVQKMRAFITKMSGSAPQFMTTDQWEEMLQWFESFVTKNATKGLIKYINDSLGVK
jgi:hypothetical protein